jgi:hypothetical protein
MPKPRLELSWGFFISDFKRRLESTFALALPFTASYLRSAFHCFHQDSA